VTTCRFARPTLPVEHVVGLGRGPHAGRDAQALAQISRVIREFRPHIVHTHKAKAGVLGRTAAWIHRVPATVHTFHGHLLTGYFSPAKTQVVVNVERAYAWKTTRLVAIGAQVRDELLAAKSAAERSTSSCRPGTALGSVPSRDEARRALGLPLDAVVVSFVGRLTAVKRPERFVGRRRASRGPNGPTFFFSGGGRGRAPRVIAGAGSSVGWPRPVPRLVERGRVGLRGERRRDADVRQ